jgi:Domain of unknown function (DUF222)
MSVLAGSVAVMSITPSSTRPHPVTDALEAVEATLGQAADSAMWSLSDGELLAALEASERALARLAEAQLRLVREADARDVAGRVGATSTAALLRHRLRISPADAKARVELAAALDRELAATGARLTAGAVSVDQAQAVRRAVERLPAGLPAGTARQAEATLLEHAATFGPVELARLGAHIRHVLAAGELEESEREATERRELYLVDRRDGTWGLRGALDAEAAARLRTALDPLAAPRPADPGNGEAGQGRRDPRSPARRRADALVELVDRVLDAGVLPATAGVRPHVTVTVPFETLLPAAGVTAAELDWGEPISGAAVRRVCCDAGITRVLLDPAGVPLDVGREHRLVPPGLRRAVVARDRCCAFPGCDRPPGWCECHHIDHWINGGETALHNLVLLCRRHHTAVHHHGWAVRLAADRLPEFIPPRWIDPDQKPRRNPHSRRPDEVLARAG